MRKPVDNAMSFAGGSATNRFLLAVPPEQIQERLFQIISTYNLVYALILSGLIGVVCAPLDPTEYSADRENVVIAYNALICIGFMLSANGVLHTSWALTQIANLTPDTAFRFVIQGDLLWVQEALSLLTMVAVMAASVVAVWIRCSLLVSAVLSAVAILLFCATVLPLSKWLMSASVHVAWSYNRMGPASRCNPMNQGEARRQEAERIGCYLADQVEARLGLRPSKTPPPGGAVPSVTADHVTELERSGSGGSGGGGELAGLVAQALPDRQPSGASEIAEALARHGLSVRVLREASAEGALADVYAVLRDVPELNAGERLAIATAARRYVAA